MAQTLQDPNALIAEQFAKSRKGIESQKLQAIDELRAQSGRQQALTGMGGGSLLKAQEKAQRNLENQFLGAEEQLAAQEAGVKLQESQYARGQAQQESQFQRGQQEAARQFDKQYGLSEKEFAENVNTNRLNALMNLGKLDYQDKTWNRIMDQFKGLSSGNRLLVDTQIRLPGK